MQPPSQAPRTPASGHDTDRAGPRRSTNPSAQCENCPSRQTQYPRFHELAHALGVGYREYGRRKAEVIVDTVTFVVCAGVGLDVGGESIPYVAGWGEDGALEAVTEFAGVIDTLAHKLEDAIAVDPVDVELATT